MKHWILSREGSLSIILVIWLFNSCVLKLKYASLVDIFKNYFSCFKDKEGHLLIAPLLNYKNSRLFGDVVVIIRDTMRSNII